MNKKGEREREIRKLADMHLPWLFSFYSCVRPLSDSSAP